MAGLHGVTLPAGLAGALGPLAGTLAAVGVSFEGVGGGTVRGRPGCGSRRCCRSRFAPNVAEIMRRHAPALDAAQFDTDPDAAERRGALAWRPSRRWALATAALGAVAMLSLFKVSEFLYYQFLNE